jgi:serine/threonine protein kinase
MAVQQFQPVPPQNPKLSKPRPTPFAVKKSLTSEIPDSQEWLQARFEALKPQDISDRDVAMYTVRDLAAPSAFHRFWYPIGDHHRNGGTVPAEEQKLLSSAHVILVFADINDRNQMEDLKVLASFFQSFYETPERPRVMLVQHSVKPSVRPSFDADARFHTLTDLTRNGVHDSILDEKTSFQMALAVRNRLLQRVAVQQQWRDCILANREMIEAMQESECNIDALFWDYLRVRLKTRLPPVDPNIAPGMPTELDGAQVGPFVGAGLHGEVYELMNTGHVMKRIPKAPLTNMNGIEKIRKEIEVMELISSKNWVHPNVVKLHNIYHSETHVLFRMCDGGSRDLKKRLTKRDNPHSPLNALSADKAKAIMFQMLSAISHLHTGPKVVHCDLKCENIILKETADGIDVTISDFDSALANPSLPHYGIFGSYPIMAPEILLHEQCDPFAADVWSIAMVFLEIATGLGIIEKALNLQRLTAQVSRRVLKTHQKKMMAQVHGFFSQEDSIDKLLEEHLRPELQDARPLLNVVLPGMLKVLSACRSTSSEALEAVKSTQ